MGIGVGDGVATSAESSSIISGNGTIVPSGSVVKTTTRVAVGTITGTTGTDVGVDRRRGRFVSGVGDGTTVEVATVNVGVKATVGLCEAVGVGIGLGVDPGVFVASGGRVGSSGGIAGVTVGGLRGVEIGVGSTVVVGVWVAPLVDVAVGTLLVGVAALGVGVFVV